MEAITAMYGERTHLRSKFESGSVPLDYYVAHDLELSARCFHELGDAIQRQGVIQWATGAEEMQHLVNRKFNQIAKTK